MGVFEQLPTDRDRDAATMLANYLIETEGNRFYGQDIADVRNHIAGNDQLMAEAHKFSGKLAEMQAEADALASKLEARASSVVPIDPVKQMMSRFMSPTSRKAFSERIETLLKERAQKH